MTAQDFTFAAGEHRLAATRILPPDGVGTGAGDGGPRVLHLHGLGPTASRHTVRYLLDPLAEQGHGSITFEYSGNGDSTGVLTGSSLRRRRDETLAAVAQLGGRRGSGRQGDGGPGSGGPGSGGWGSGGPGPVLLATSMGAHLAAWTVPQVRPAALVFFCPAAYPEHAQDLRFDGGLSRPGDYAHSPAYAGIEEFTGDLLIIGARNDEVVAPRVIEGYVARAVRARSTRVLWLEDCDHFVHRRLPLMPERVAEVSGAILRLLAAEPEATPGRPGTAERTGTAQRTGSAQRTGTAERVVS